MAVSLPTQCSVALKEWATVVEAMARGKQLVLIRKGGLIEPGSGFAVQAETFVFYPTFEHQAVQYLRPEFTGYFDAAQGRRVPGGTVGFELIGHAVASWSTHDATIVSRLRGVHIYNEAFLTQRLKWQPEQPLMIVLVRAWRLPQAVQVVAQPQYAGCKSWVELEVAIPLTGATPILDEARFQEHRLAVNALLGSR